MSHAPGFPILLQHAYTEAEWAADNPVLMERETGWTTDTLRVKLGDGVTAWNDLPYAADEAAAVAVEQARAEAAEAALQADIDAEVTRATGIEAGLQTQIDAIDVTDSTQGKFVSTDASFGLAAPTGVGGEFVITGDVLDDIRYNGASL